jgi:flagellar basal-body rod modification protein FlgD
MNVKNGVQTWSTSQQFVNNKSDGAQNISATDRDKVFQDEAIGDTLNKVSDPNYVDTSKKMRTVGNPDLGKDAFMSLLLAQMKNQDPTNPLKSHEMAAQLAQFTQLEKLQNIDSGIEGLRKDAQPDHNLQALGFIGKAVMTDNSRVSHANAEEGHDIRFNLPADAQTVSIRIKDAEGNLVRNIETRNAKTGKNTINWNGKNEDGQSTPVGEYVAEFEALSSNGKKLHVESKVEGLITGVQFTAKGPMLMVGRQAVQMSEVKTITDPNVSQESLKAQAPSAAPGPSNIGGIQEAIAAAMKAQGASPSSNMMPIPAQQPKKVEVKPETKENAEKRANIKSGNINDLAMSQGMINNLGKSGVKAGM